MTWAQISALRPAVLIEVSFLGHSHIYVELSHPPREIVSTYFCTYSEFAALVSHTYVRETKNEHDSYSQKSVHNAICLTATEFPLTLEMADNVMCSAFSVLMRLTADQLPDLICCQSY
jgi:hypothetical protein